MRSFALLGRLICGSLLALSTSLGAVAATTVTYTYDEQGRLETSWSDNGTNATAVTYSYDTIGNRLGVTTAVFDTAKPGVPTGLTATAVAYSQINLSWSAVSDAGGSGLAGYKIYRGGTQIATTASTSYSDTTVFGEQTYTYTVAAYDNAQNVSAQSGSASATTPPAPDTTPPSVPAGLSASAVSSTQVNLNWTPSTDTGGSGLAGYRIYRNGSQIGTSATNSFTDTSTTGGVQYSYTVTAYDNAAPPNVSGQSNTASVTPPDTLPPTVPTGLSASAPSSTQVNLSWSASSDPGGSGVAAYRVYRSGTYIGTTSTTSFTDTSTAGSTYYTYTIDAYDNASPANISGQSAAVGVTTPDTIAPSVPTGLNFTLALATQVQLNWSASTDTGGSGVAGYHVYRDGAYIGASASATYTDNTVSASTTYTYSVAAYDNAGNTSAASAGASVTTQTVYIPITSPLGAILPDAQDRYTWTQSCGLLGGVIPYCDRLLQKVGVGFVWSMRYVYGSTPPPAGWCPSGSGSAGYQQIANTCVIQALPSVY